MGNYQNETLHAVPGFGKDTVWNLQGVQRNMKVGE